MDGLEEGKIHRAGRFGAEKEARTADQGIFRL